MMAQAAGMVTLERFDPQSDLAILSAWLSAPHVARFWGDPDPNLSKARQRDPGSHALIAVGGTPVGYLCWQKPSSHELEDAGLADLPPGLVDIDILIEAIRIASAWVSGHAPWPNFSPDSRRRA